MQGIDTRGDVSLVGHLPCGASGSCSRERCRIASAASG
jgi:hypothetical protein